MYVSTHPDIDREGVAQGLSECDDPDSLAIARWVKDKLRS